MANTASGFLIQKRFKPQGKRTIDNPGLLTTLFGDLPIGAALRIPEKLCRDRNTPYGFTWGAGYFARFCDKGPDRPGKFSSCFIQ